MTLADTIASIRGSPSSAAPSSSQTGKPAPIAPMPAYLDEYRGVTRLYHTVKYVAGQAVNLPQSGLYLSYICVSSAVGAWLWTYDGTSTAVFPSQSQRGSIWRIGSQNQVGSTIPASSMTQLGNVNVYLVFTTVPLTAPGPSAYRGSAQVLTLAAGVQNATFQFAGIQAAPLGATVNTQYDSDVVLGWPPLGSLLPQWVFNNSYGPSDGMIAPAPPYQASSSITVSLNSGGAQAAVVVIWY